MYFLQGNAVPWKQAGNLMGVAGRALKAKKR